MTPKDFSKKNFKLIPGGDYSQPEYDTFGKMIKGGINKVLESDAMFPRASNKFEDQGAISPSYFEFDAITAPLGAAAGMFVPLAKKADNYMKDIVPKFMKVGDKSRIEHTGTFSDRFSRNYMKWVDDSKARVRSVKEIASRRRAKYYPEHLEQKNFDHPVDWEEATADELSRLQRLRDEMPIGDREALSDNAMRMDWVRNPRETMAELQRTDGTNVFSLEEVLDHPEFFAAFPRAKNTTVAYDLFKGPRGSHSGRYDAIRMGNSYEFEPERGLSTLLHEAQHAVQDKAGWPRGGNIKEFEGEFRKERNALIRKRNQAAPEEVAAIQNQIDNLPTATRRYFNLWGEQQARAVQAALRNKKVATEPFSNTPRAARREAILRERDAIEENEIITPEMQQQLTELKDEFQLMRRKFRPASPFEAMGMEEGLIPDPLIKFRKGGIINNPTSEMIQTGASTKERKPFSAETKKELVEGLNHYKERGNINGMRGMSRETRQDLANRMFSSRDEARNIGFPTMSQEDVNHFGFTAPIRPKMFLEQANERMMGLSDSEKATDFSNFMMDEIIKGKAPRVAPPKLQAEIIDDAKIQITSHEGRHRSDMMDTMLGGKDDDLFIPVDYQFQERRGGLPDNTLDLPVINQDGLELGTTLREMLPEGFDTSALTPNKPVTPRTGADPITKRISEIQGRLDKAKTKAAEYEENFPGEQGPWHREVDWVQKEMDEVTKKMPKDIARAGQDYSGRNIQSEKFTNYIKDNRKPGGFSGDVFRGVKNIPGMKQRTLRSGKVLGGPSFSDKLKSSEVGDIIESKQVDGWIPDDSVAESYARDDGIILKNRLKDRYTSEDTGMAPHRGQAGATHEVYAVGNMRVVTKETENGREIITVEYVND